MCIYSGETIFLTCFLFLLTSTDRGRQIFRDIILGLFFYILRNEGEAKIHLCLQGGNTENRKYEMRSDPYKKLMQYSIKYLCLAIIVTAHKLLFEEYSFKSTQWLQQYPVVLHRLHSNKQDMKYQKFCELYTVAAKYFKFCLAIHIYSQNGSFTGRQRVSIL